MFENIHSDKRLIIMFENTHSDRVLIMFENIHSDRGLIIMFENTECKTVVNGTRFVALEDFTDRSRCGHFESCS